MTAKLKSEGTFPAAYMFIERGLCGICIPVLSLKGLLPIGRGGGSYCILAMIANGKD